MHSIHAYILTEFLSIFVTEVHLQAWGQFMNHTQNFTCELHETPEMNNNIDVYETLRLSVP